MSRRNCPPNSAAAADSSASYASAMTRGSTRGFIVAVSACQTNTGSPFLPKCFLWAVDSTPRRA